MSSSLANKVSKTAPGMTSRETLSLGASAEAFEFETSTAVECPVPKTIAYNYNVAKGTNNFKILLNIRSCTTEDEINWMNTSKNFSLKILIGPSNIFNEP